MEALDRESPSYCASVLEGCVKNKKVRRECLGLLAEAIVAANSHSPAGWAVTLFSYGLRLNVGSTEAYALFGDKIRLLLDPGAGLGPELSPFLSSSPYRSAPPETQIFDAPAVTVPKYLQAVRSPFLVNRPGFSGDSNA